MQHGINQHVDRCADVGAQGHENGTAHSLWLSPSYVWWGCPMWFQVIWSISHSTLAAILRARNLNKKHIIYTLDPTNHHLNHDNPSIYYIPVRYIRIYIYKYIYKYVYIYMYIHHIFPCHGIMVQVKLPIPMLRRCCKPYQKLRCRRPMANSLGWSLGGDYRLRGWWKSVWRVGMSNKINQVVQKSTLSHQKMADPYQIP